MSRPTRRLVRLVKHEVTLALQCNWPPFVYRVLSFMLATCDADNWLPGTQPQWSAQWGVDVWQISRACVRLQRAGLLEYHPRRANGTRTWNTTTAWRLSTRLVRPYTAPWWIRARWGRPRRGG